MSLSIAKVRRGQSYGFAPRAGCAAAPGSSRRGPPGRCRPRRTASRQNNTLEYTRVHCSTNHQRQLLRNNIYIYIYIYIYNLYYNKPPGKLQGILDKTVCTPLYIYIYIYTHMCVYIYIYIYTQGAHVLNHVACSLLLMLFAVRLFVLLFVVSLFV